jgi:hypothetical protein
MVAVVALGVRLRPAIDVLVEYVRRDDAGWGLA